jgi:hypothetical protein
MKRASDPIRRAVRTLLQLIAGGGLSALVTEVLADIDDATAKAAIALLAAFLVSWAQNELEDRGAVPALLKATASSGENPVPDPRPNRLTE